MRDRGGARAAGRRRRRSLRIHKRATRFASAPRRARRGACRRDAADPDQRGAVGDAGRRPRGHDARRAPRRARAAIAASRATSTRVSVVRVLPGMQAAFVEIGLEKAAFLHVSDLAGPDLVRGVIDETEAENGDAEIGDDLDAAPPRRRVQFAPIEERLAERPGAARPGVEGADRHEGRARHRERLAARPLSRAHAGHGPRRHLAADRGRRGARPPARRRRVRAPARRRLHRAHRPARARPSARSATTSASSRGSGRTSSRRPRPRRRRRSSTATSTSCCARCATSSRPTSIGSSSTIRTDHARIRRVRRGADAAARRRASTSTRARRRSSSSTASRRRSRARSSAACGSSPAATSSSTRPSRSTTVDVNTGRYVGKKDQEETVLKTNLEAAKQVVQQLRLRNIGGIIVIDFIDMEKAANRQKVFDALAGGARARQGALDDRCSISELGLVQMTRKRTRESLGQLSSSRARTATASAGCASAETIAYDALRRLQHAARGAGRRDLVPLVHPRRRRRSSQGDGAHARLDAGRDAFGRTARVERAHPSSRATDPIEPGLESWRVHGREPDGIPRSCAAARRLAAATRRAHRASRRRHPPLH